MRGALTRPFEFFIRKSWTFLVTTHACWVTLCEAAANNLWSVVSTKVGSVAGLVRNDSGGPQDPGRFEGLRPK